MTVETPQPRKGQDRDVSEQPKRSGTKVTSVDLDTGDTQEMVIRDDVCVVVDGTAYVAGVQDFRKSGTQVWTIKGRLGRSRS